MRVNDTLLHLLSLRVLLLFVHLEFRILGNTLDDCESDTLIFLVVALAEVVKDVFDGLLLGMLL